MKQNKDYCGQFTENQIRNILKNTRMSETNRNEMVNYFANGTRLKDLSISKQAATSRIRKVIDLLDK
jgi:hypothetical protein